MYSICFCILFWNELNGQALTNFISSEYTDDDFNMDGSVIFQGPNNDKSTFLFNTILKHPGNDNNFSNFIISTAQVKPPNCIDADNDGFVTICHKLGTPAQQAITISVSALGVHGAHGEDYCGPCNN